MSFTSPEYVIFLSVFFLIFFQLPHAIRWVFLLIASYTFYAFGHAEYLWLIAFTTITDYIAARLIAATDAPRRRKTYLFVSLAVNLGVLFIYKYFDFAADTVAVVLGMFGIQTNIAMLELELPIGISFYTFQSMAYTIDVYRGKIAPEKHLGIFANYIAYFPQLVAGPIERATNLLPQFHLRKTFDTARAVDGLRLILWGVFKKIVIADRVGIYVNAVYNDLGSYTGVPLIMATFFFTIQLYCDFSAYSDIAIGTGRIMGFDLIQNFRQPYLARTPREFWSRWHMSLSAWFRDYLYIPLGGNRVSFPRHLVNLFIVFAVSGLWHGAHWTFVIWGVLNGVYVVIENIFLRWRKTSTVALPSINPYLAAFLQWGLTFTLIVFTRVFFRANSISDALYVFNNLSDFSNGAFQLLTPFAGAIMPVTVEFLLAFGLIAILFAIDIQIERTGSVSAFWAQLSGRARWALYYAMGAAIIFSGLYGTGAQEFIYFQF